VVEADNKIHDIEADEDKDDEGATREDQGETNKAGEK